MLKVLDLGLGKLFCFRTGTRQTSGPRTKKWKPELAKHRVSAQKIETGTRQTAGSSTKKQLPELAKKWVPAQKLEE
jgi:hypothetical protein